jgi:hypothetical protein
VEEDDDTRARGGRRAPKPEECAWAPEERMVVQRRREHTTAVGRELKQFGRKRTDAGRDIFILLKHINNGSQLESMLIKISVAFVNLNHC